MGKLTFAIGAVFLTAVLLFFLFSETSALAIAGCCKERSSYNSPWQRVNKNYEQCKVHNDKKDGDNIFDERGYVWWDSNCR